MRTVMRTPTQSKSVWALLKRQIIGIHHVISQKAEVMWRYIGATCRMRYGLVTS
jgi:hypothetical protein